MSVFYIGQLDYITELNNMLNGTRAFSKLAIDDANFNLDIVSSKPRITFDANDYLEFDRATNVLGFRMGSTLFASIGATAVATLDGFTIHADGANGANLEFRGDGATTPNKYLRVVGGTMQWLNSDYSAVIAQLTDAGQFKASSTTPFGTLQAAANGAGAAVGTLNNAPAAGNPTKWIPFDDNGTIRYIPTW